MQALREHFEPIIAQQEDDYNEEFCLETRVKIVNLTGVDSSSATKTTKTRTTQSALILEAIQQSNATMQSQSNAILQSNAQILEAMKSQSQASAINWAPLIQAVAIAIPAVVGVQVAPLQTPTPTPTPAAPVITTLPSTDPILARLETKLEAVSNTVAQLQTATSPTPSTPPITDLILAKLEALTNTVNNLSQGFNTLTQIVAQMQASGNPSNGSSTPRL